MRRSRSWQTGAAEVLTDYREDRWGPRARHSSRVTMARSRNNRENSACAFARARKYESRVREAEGGVASPLLPIQIRLRLWMDPHLISSFGIKILRALSNLSRPRFREVRDPKKVDWRSRWI